MEKIDMEQLTTLCKPIIDLLNEKHDPYTEIHISSNEIKITVVACSILPIEADS